MIELAGDAEMVAGLMVPEPSDAERAELPQATAEYLEALEADNAFMVREVVRLREQLAQRPLIPTAREIEAAKTRSGGWTRHTLARWGVPWPPPKGWRRALIAAHTAPR